MQIEIHSLLLGLSQEEDNIHPYSYDSYHMSRGEYYLLLGKDQEAMNEFQFALRLVRNNFQVTESIMTKINEIKKNQRRR